MMRSVWDKVGTHNFGAVQVLWCLIFVALVISIFFRLSLGYNTLHFDEAGYLFVGERLLNGAQWPTKTYVFSSDFPLILLAFFQKYFGEYGGRIFSAVVSFASLVYFYKIVSFARFSLSLRFLTLALACVQVSHIAISRLATYDALCFFFMTASTYYSMLSITKKSMFWLIVSASAFLLSVFSKYIAIAYLPVFYFFLFLRSPRVALVFFGLTFPVLLGYVVVYYDSLIVLFQGQVQGSHANNVPPITLLKTLIFMFWPLVLWGLLMFPFLKWVDFKIIFVLLSAASPVVAYHFYNKDFISLYKHSVYCSFALSFLVCYLVHCYRKPYIFNVNMNYFLSALVVLTLANSIYWIKESESGWPNYKALYTYVDAHSNENTRILSEDPYNFRYRYSDRIALKNLKDVNWFDYNQDGVREEKDVLDAARDGYFSYIIVDESIRPNLVGKLKGDENLAHYERVLYQPNIKVSALVNRNTSASIALYQRK